MTLSTSAAVLLPVAIDAALKAGDDIMGIYREADFGIRYKADASPLTRADRKAHKRIRQSLAGTGIPLLSEEGKPIPYKKRASWELFWLVDPLDGTREFIKRNGEFTVNIALIEHGKPVLGVVYAPDARVLWYGSEKEGAFRCVADPVKTVETLMAGSIPLPLDPFPRPFRVACSSSHLDSATEAFIRQMGNEHPFMEIIKRGSSLKFCMIAEGTVDIYPRFGPTHEWDTAAGHAIVIAAGGSVNTADHNKPLIYNKPDLMNPFFIVRGREGNCKL